MRNVTKYNINIVIDILYTVTAVYLGSKDSNSVSHFMAFKLTTRSVCMRLIGIHFVESQKASRCPQNVKSLENNNNNNSSVGKSTNNTSFDRKTLDIDTSFVKNG